MPALAAQAHRSVIVVGIHAAYTRVFATSTHAPANTSGSTSRPALRSLATAPASHLSQVDSGTRSSRTPPKRTLRCGSCRQSTTPQLIALAVGQLCPGVTERVREDRDFTAPRLCSQAAALTRCAPRSRRRAGPPLSRRSQRTTCATADQPPPPARPLLGRHRRARRSTRPGRHRQHIHARPQRRT